ncbi:hypothetical protein [Pseudoduganella violaceinigra]|uniref:hypothetical protein n=1 Tax=Pseudoduganella violaceinigra TaxID=246602 RepID=UPI00040FBE4D|nr:hypothetical protein [Pseudoduganella violaceinigra]
MSDLLHISSTLAKIIARINPYIWEVIGGGPLGKRFQISTLAADPEPAPWRQENAWLREAQFAAVEVARRQVYAACAIATQGGDPAAFTKGALEDWCPTGAPPRLPSKFPTEQRIPRPPKPADLELYSLPITGAIAIIVESESIADPALAKLIADFGAAVLDRSATYATETLRSAR